MAILTTHESPHLHSPHAWLGVLTVTLMMSQVAAGLTYLLPKDSSLRIVPKGFHKRRRHDADVGHRHEHCRRTRPDGHACQGQASQKSQRGNADHQRAHCVVASNAAVLPLDAAAVRAHTGREEQSSRTAAGQFQRSVVQLLNDARMMTVYACAVRHSSTCVLHASRAKLPLPQRLDSAAARQAAAARQLFARAASRCRGTAVCCCLL